MSGYDNHGEFFDGTSVIYYDIGGSMYFEGSTAYVNCGNDSSVQLTSEITIMAWVYLESTAGGYTCGTFVEKGGATGFRFRVCANEELYWVANGNSISGGSVPLDTWVNLCVIGNSSGMFAYINNVLVASNGTAYSPTGASSGNLQLGTYPLEFLKGYMAVVMMYNKSLTHEERLQNYGATLPRFSSTTLPQPTPSVTPSITVTPTPSTSPGVTPTTTPSATPSVTPSPSGIFGTISLSPTFNNYDENGDGYVQDYVTVTSSGAWTAAIKTDWDNIISSITTSGGNNASAYTNVITNSSSGTKFAIITYTVSGGAHVDLTICQDGTDFTCAF